MSKTSVMANLSSLLTRLGLVAVLAAVVYVLWPSEGGRRLLPGANPGAGGGVMDYGLEVQSPDGQTLDFATLRGRVLFINHWATWCPPCRVEMPSIQRLYEETRDLGVVFVLVSMEDPGTVGRYVEREGYTFPVYSTGGRRLPGALTTRGIPATFIVAADGRIATRHVGSAAWDAPDVVEHLRALVTEAAQSSEQPVPQES